MAKRHVNLYYLQCQNQYLDMLENLKEFKRLASEGKVSEEDYNQMLREVELVKSNYERISYIMLLLNKPNRKSKEDNDMNLSWYSCLTGSSKEAILDENKDVLTDLKKIIEEANKNA